VADSQHERSDLDHAVRHGRSILSLADEPRTGALPGAVGFNVCAWCAPECFDQAAAEAKR
jgi:hypothetical protein